MNVIQRTTHTSITKPTLFNNFRGKVNKAFALLKDLFEAKHSFSTAKNGEGKVPTHLYDVYSRYYKLRSCAESDTSSKEVAKKNREIQKDVINVVAPLGVDSNAPPRESTRAGNAKKSKGLKLVPRGKDVSQKSAFIDIAADGDSYELEDDAITPPKRRKSNSTSASANKKKKKIDVMEVLEDNNKRSENISDAVVAMKESSDSKIKLEKENQKMKLEEMKNRNSIMLAKEERKAKQFGMTFELQKEKMQHDKQQNMITYLKNEYDEACKKVEDAIDANKPASIISRYEDDAVTLKGEWLKALKNQQN